MFIPSKKILENYARVMVDFALGKGKGVKKGEVVFIQYDIEAKPLALEIFRRVLEIGAYPMTRSYDEDFEKTMFDIASNDQLKFLPKKYTKALVETIDHRVYLMAPKDPFLLKDIDPKKIILANQSKNFVKKLIFEKEDKGKLSWSICLYGTEGMAKEAGLSLEEFWKQIINACFLDLDEPIKKWKEVFSQIENIRQKLNQMPIDKIHFISKNTDLWISLGEKRVWQGGRGANIPSFEIFTSPDWRGTEGKVYFNFPLYRYGNLIKDIYLEFKDGKIIKAKASSNEKLFKEMIKQKNADKIGEFSLTDKRFSRINQFMANTLYDENFGGEWGNSHIAVGSSYHDCFLGDKKKMKKKDWEKLGFNESIEHTDIINTEKKQIETILKNGIKKVIYKDGLFMI
ncbi:MAG: aminopeptidase [Patescibacteria group bacterium]|nr:aminopeptidase [Patescibacteria group bacterium]